MDPSIFRENDIRGRAGIDIGLDEVQTLGQAIGTYLRERGLRRVVVGRDARATSTSWSRQSIRGLVAAGCEVLDVGLCTTPCLCFGIDHLQADAAVMVTASHNAADFNGLKIVVGSAPLHGQEVRRIREIVESGGLMPGHGRVDKAGLVSAYLSELTSDLKMRRSLRVGVDAGSGPAGDLAGRLLKTIGAEVFTLKPQCSAQTGPRLIDPAREEELDCLGRFVFERGLDLGLAFDSDADRLGVVNSSGEPVRADELLVVFARTVLRENPGATVVAEVLCSQRLFDEVVHLGGRAVMWKTGHSLIRRKMQQERALLAGELSGHFFFADRFLGHSDAIYAAGRLLEILSAGSRSLPELLADLPVMQTSPRIQIPCSDGIKLPLMAAVDRALRRLAAEEQALVVDVDGVRISWPDGWAVVRPSNTEPAIVLRVEAASEERLTQIRSTITNLIDAELRHYVAAGVDPAASLTAIGKE